MAVILNVFIGKSRGGIEVVCSDYAKAFAAQGHHSYLLGAKGRDYIEYLQNTELPLKLLAGRNVNPFTLFQFAWFLARLKPDIVFLHGTRAVTVGTKWYIRRLFPKVKFVGVSHGVADKRYAKLKYAIAITPYLQDCFTALGIKHIYLLPNTTKIFPFQKEKPRRSPAVIGSMGRFSPAKGFDILISAAGILKEQGIPFKIKLAGFSKDECADMLKAHNVLKETEVIGWINDKDNFYQDTDIYVSSARFESFGLTIIEAMARSVAVIATETIGASAIISSGVNGTLVPQENPKELAAAIASLLAADKEKFDRIRQAGHSETETKYNLAKLPKALDTILQSIMATDDRR